MSLYEQISNYSYLGSKDVLGGLPVVEQTQAFIATFKGAVSTTPEVINNSSFFITYLVDQDSNVYKVSEDSDAQRDIVQNFKLGSDVIVRVDQGTLLNTQLSGRHSISGIGSFDPIVVSQTGSSKIANVINLSFLAPGEIESVEGSNIVSLLGANILSGSDAISPPSLPGDSVAWVTGQTDGLILPAQAGQQDVFSFSLNNPKNTNYNPDNPSAVGGYVQLLTAFTSSNPNTSGASWEYIGDASSGYPNIPGGGITNKSNGYYLFANPLSEFTSVTFNINAFVYNFKDSQQTVTMGLVRRRLGSDTIIGTNNFNISGYFDLPNATQVYGALGNANFTVSSNDIQAGDRFYAIIGSFLSVTFLDTGGTSTQGEADADLLRLGNKRVTFGTTTRDVPFFEFKVSAQNPSPPITQDQRPFWATGSNTTTVLTASSDLSNQVNNFQIIPTASSDFGFSPVTVPFTVQVGDKIRFEYNNDNIFTIFKVETPPTSDRLYLTLDRALGSNLNLNNFILYRNLEDGKFITLDVEKFDPPIAEEEFTGIIIPEYASSTLRQNASEIVSKLKQDGIFED